MRSTWRRTLPAASRASRSSRRWSAFLCSAATVPSASSCASRGAWCSRGARQRLKLRTRRHAEGVWRRRCGFSPLRSKCGKAGGRGCGWTRAMRPSAPATARPRACCSRASSWREVRPIWGVRAPRTWRRSTCAGAGSRTRAGWRRRWASSRDAWTAATARSRSTSAVRRRASPAGCARPWPRSEEHTSELQSPDHLVCRLLLEKKKKGAHPNYVSGTPPVGLYCTYQVEAVVLMLSDDTGSTHGHFSYICFFFNDTATTEIYTLSLHDALPISTVGSVDPFPDFRGRETLKSD